MGEGNTGGKVDKKTNDGAPESVHPKAIKLNTFEL